MLKIATAVLLSAAMLLSTAAAASAETIITIDDTKTYQTMESFGGSGAWWSQYVGEWDDEYNGTGRSVRDQIALLLYDREEGIGLTSYRYNLGAGSADSGNGEYSDVHRRAQSFETAPGVYDWNKDASAVYMLKQMVAEGAEEVILFFNSPLERLTINGTAQVTKGQKKNIEPENYAEWAKYACDVAEHFLEMGIPVKFLSPINEPQWDWYPGNQEGCHYEPTEIAKVYIAFLEEMQKRPALAGVELSGPESGEWGGQTTKYVSALLGNQTLAPHMTTVDCHSYWSDTASKVSFRNWMDLQYPDVKVRMSEWCEMVNGSDYGMDSALVLAKTVAEDLTILNAVSWQTWVEVAPGGYHDGLIYALETNHAILPLKRLWALGNYSRYVRPGYVRVATSGGEALHATAFTGVENGKKQLVVVVVNDDTKSTSVKLEGNFNSYNSIIAYETSTAHDLEKVAERIASTKFTLPAQSVTTFVFSE